MSESVFDKRKLTDVYEEIRKVYLSDNRPWIIGFSGGKDSTCLVQLVWNALSELSPEKLQKQVAEKLGYKLVDHRLELYGSKIIGDFSSSSKQM